MSDVPYVLDIFYPAPNSVQEVIVTGDFDQWEGKQKMEVWKTTEESTLFILRIPMICPSKPEKFLFKFIVDGQWCCSTNYDIEATHQFKNNMLLYGPGKQSVPLRLASEPPTYLPVSTTPKLKDSFMEKDPRFVDTEDDVLDISTVMEEPPYERLYASDEEDATEGEDRRKSPMFSYPPSYHINYHYDPEPVHLMHTIGLGPTYPSDPTVPLIPPTSPSPNPTVRSSYSPKMVSLKGVFSEWVSAFTSLFHQKSTAAPSSSSTST